MDISKEENEFLEQLLSHVMELHSFKYSSLAEAKKTVQIDSIVYCFDALSLSVYSCNLKPRFIGEFKKKLLRYYEAHFNKEEQKERAERESLFYYLTYPTCEYTEYIIKKQTRPDFVLEGKNIIGIEVVGLTTQTDQVYYSILKENLGKGKSISEIEAAAKKKHGEKAKVYDYLEIDDSPSILSTTSNTGTIRSHFADLMLHKYQKYENDIPSFDRFIVLGDARRVGQIAVTNICDVEDIFESLRNYSEMKNVTHTVLWEDNESNSLQVTELRL